MPVMSEGDYRYNKLMAAFPSLPEPAFETAEMQELVWGRRWGCATDVGRLRAVLVHRPGVEIKVVDPDKYIAEIGAFDDVETGWYWRGGAPPPPPPPPRQSHPPGGGPRGQGGGGGAVRPPGPGRGPT